MIMTAEKGNEAGPSKTVEQLELEETLEETLGLASENFDPMRVIYAPSLGIEDENVEVYDSVSELMEHVQLDVGELQEEDVAVNIGEIQEDSSHGGRDDGHDGEICSQSSSAAASKPESSPSHDFTMQTPAIDCINKDVDRNTADVSVIVKQSAITAAESVSQRHDKKPECETKSEQPITSEEFGDKSEVKLSATVAAESVSQTDEKEPECETESEPPEISEELGNKNEMEPLSYRKKQVRKNVLTQMEEGFQHGPLSILKRSVQEKIKVRVWTRSVRNIRGISTGYVVAFDKHMNLAMIDVDEIYRKPVGKHQRKKKKPKDHAAPPAENSQISEEAAEALYPKTPWKPISGQAGCYSTEAGDVTEYHEAMNWDDDSGEEHDGSHGRVPGHPPADGIGSLPSLFSGMHVFDENETTRFLGVKSKKLLTRHLNQVLLRGEHVVAVSLVELNL